MHAPNRTLAAISIAAVTLAASACGGDDDASAVQPTTTATAPATTTEATATTEAPATTTEAPPTTQTECDNGRTHGSYERHQVCKNGQWQDDPQPRPTTTTAAPTTTTTVKPAPQTDPALDRATVDWWMNESQSQRELGCQIGFDSVSALLPTFSGVPHQIERTTFEFLCAGGSPVVGGPNAIPPEEVEAVIAAAANAWLAEPSGPTYDALAAAAQSLIDSGRPLAPEIKHAMESLAVYPGSDLLVFTHLGTLKLPSVAVPFILRKGSYLVGAEVPPGTYRALNVKDCYWETLDEAGEINDNNFIFDAPQVLMTVRSSDYAVNNDCAVMVKID